MEREIQRTRRFFGYAADQIAAISGQDAEEVLAVLYGADFVGAGGKDGLGGRSRRTSRAMPCDGVLGSGRWHAQDGHGWWKALVGAIEQRRATLPELKPETVERVARTRLVEVDALWALATRVGIGIERSLTVEANGDEKSKLGRAGFEGERFLDFFRCNGGLSSWQVLSEAIGEIKAKRPEIATFVAHPASVSKFGLMPYGQIWWVNEATMVVSSERTAGSAPAWVVCGYDAPWAHSKYEWRQQ